jgi:hypothetical protein
LLFVSRLCYLGLLFARVAADLRWRRPIGQIFPPKAPPNRRSGRVARFDNLVRGHATLSRNGTGSTLGGRDVTRSACHRSPARPAAKQLGIARNSVYRLLGDAA